MIQLDRIVAVVISTAVILMGFTVQQRAQQTSVSSTMLYVGKKQTLELADMLERDLANVGFGTSPNEVAITSYTVTPQNLLQRLEFLGSDASGNQIEVRYDVVFVDSVASSGEYVSIYELQRFENLSGTWTRNGGSPSTLTQFSIDLLDENNIPVAKENARRLRIRLENMVFPQVQVSDYMDAFRRIHWGITMSPPNLRGYQNT
jgi:hypothetical protein